MLIALALVAAACGGDGASEGFAAPATTIGESAGQTSPTTVDAGPTTIVPSDGATTTTPPATTPAELPDSHYPDVVVADLAGGEVNLRELALEAEPVLLWFWAPH